MIYSPLNLFRMKRSLIGLVLTGALLAGCGSGIYMIPGHFRADHLPPAPDYSRPSSWAAHPDLPDAADSVPIGAGFVDRQAEARADVFFIYPTIYTDKPTDSYDWNADIGNAGLRQQIQTSTILNQASIFNGCCRVYSPYYRQAHYAVFLTPNAQDKEQALRLAYEDVRTAFRYYLDHHNDGRPIVIASHSQGSLHAELLLREFFDGQPLQSRLVAAYIPGRAVKPDAFRNIAPSRSPDQTGVFASWCTFLEGYYPESYESYYKGAVATNPLTWDASPDYAPASLNRGGVALKFRFAPNLADARSVDGMLWIKKPYVRGRAWVRIKNWHRADMNLFYMNIRENAELRIGRFLDHRSASDR